jgi:hypothetical protein
MDRLIGWLVCPACLRLRMGLGHRLSCGGRR